jgi:hypothetical protein
MFVGGSGRPTRCELHDEPGHKSSYVCNLTWPALSSLRMGEFPEGLTLHLDRSDGREPGEVDRRLASVMMDEVEISKRKVVYRVYQDDPLLWPDSLWRSLCLAGLLDDATDLRWQDRFEFESLPSPEEYAANLAQCARREGFSVSNRSESGYVDLEMRKRPTRREGGGMDCSVFDCIAEGLKGVNREMLAFLARRVVLQDFATGERISFVREERGNEESVPAATAGNDDGGSEPAHAGPSSL